MAGGIVGVITVQAGCRLWRGIATRVLGRPACASRLGPQRLTHPLDVGASQQAVSNHQLSVCCKASCPSSRNCLIMQYIEEFHNGPWRGIMCISDVASSHHDTWSPSRVHM